MRIRLGLFLVGVLALAPDASANGLRENASWQFQTSADRANKTVVRQAIEQKRANFFRNVNNYDIDYNIARDYVNCNVSSRSTGNEGSVAQDAPIGSPRIAVTPAVNADTLGNRSDSIAESTTTRSARSRIGRSRAFDRVVAEDRDQTSASSSTQQANTDTALNATVEGSGIDTALGDTSGDGGGGYAALNSTQTTEGTTLTASVSDSQACAFTELTGTGGIE